MKMNPNAFAVLWAFTVLMAAAIALGPAYIYGVSVAIIVYTVFAVVG